MRSLSKMCGLQRAIDAKRIITHDPPGTTLVTEAKRPDQTSQ
ncbi:hypothetical protein DB30_07839 [Enhygromyxa salina]|uniref:Uncharacterized protein n=1 Tax=Enhygromyxa salina TaxID=215803 RepID=A0A0C2CR31_9BACT|nr:hypothetical protein DB30_07839 [Enhygromyxa salina]